MKSELVPEIHDVLKLCEDTKLPGAKGPVAPHSHPDLVYKHVRIETLTPHHLGNMFNPSFSSRSLTFFGTSVIMLRSPRST